MILQLHKTKIFPPIDYLGLSFFNILCSIHRRRNTFHIGGATIYFRHYHLRVGGGVLYHAMSHVSCHEPVALMKSAVASLRGRRHRIDTFDFEPSLSLTVSECNIV